MKTVKKKKNNYWGDSSASQKFEFREKTKDIKKVFMQV